MFLKYYQKIFLVFLYTLLGSTDIFSSTTTPSTANTDPSISAIATAAKSIGHIQNDPEGMIYNYITTHFVAAANRMASVCTMADYGSETAAAFSGTSADQGVVIGVENDTVGTFAIMQNNVVIGQVKPGWNPDVILNLSALYSGVSSTTVATPSIVFVPESGSQGSQLAISVMNGKQLISYINSEVSRESSGSGSSAVTFYKNGSNPLPGAGEVAAIQSDLYLVLENQSLSSSTPLPAAVKRIQVLNISNISTIYAVSLQLINLGLVQLNNQVSESSAISDYYGISFHSVRLLHEVKGNTIPLLVMPRFVYMAGSSINKLYATYVAAYAKQVGNTYAGIDSVYYDLVRLCPDEAFEYLRVLKYFDMSNALKPVVDQNAQIAAGTVIKNLITTDVYGAYTQQISSDISFVACSDSGLDTTHNVHVMVGFATNSPTNNTAVATVDSDELAMLNSSTTFVGIVGFVKQVINHIRSTSAPVQLAANDPDALASIATKGYPITNFSAGLLPINWSIQVHPQSISSNLWNSSGQYGQSALHTWNPLSITAGTGYTQVGSFPSDWWKLTKEEWTNGICIVPVYYNTTNATPFVSLDEFKTINPNLLASLYFYAYKGTEFIGLVPATVLNNPNQVNTYSFAPNYINFISEYTTYQSPKYEQFGQCDPSMDIAQLVAQTTQSPAEISFPGYAYLAANIANQTTFSLYNNKLSSMKALKDIVVNSWALENTMSGTWITALSVSDGQKGVILQVEALGNDIYQIVLLDSLDNVLSYQEIVSPVAVNQVIAVEFDQDGKAASKTTTMPLSATVNYFQLAATPSGIVLTPKSAAQIQQLKAAISAKAKVAPTATTDNAIQPKTTITTAKASATTTPTVTKQKQHKQGKAVTTTTTNTVVQPQQNPKATALTTEAKKKTKVKKNAKKTQPQTTVSNV